jgi:hypothetical protein
VHLGEAPPGHLPGSVAAIPASAAASIADITAFWFV